MATKTTGWLDAAGRIHRTEQDAAQADAKDALVKAGFDPGSADWILLHLDLLFQPLSTYYTTILKGKSS